MGFLFIILAATLVIYLNRSSEIANTEVFLSAKKVCSDLQTGINQAASNSFGFRINVEIPDRLLTRNYSITLDAINRTVLVKWGNFLYECPLAYQNVTNGSASFFPISFGTNQIRTNDSGVVIIEKL